jgi:peptide/nickel transport system permease protein
MVLSQNRSWQRFWQSISGRVGLVLTLMLLGLAILAPVLHPYNAAIARNFALRLQPPSPAHWFGTDALGRDLLTLVWYGTRTSLLTSLLAVSWGLGLGVSLGLAAGYLRGWVDGVISWLTDILLAFPSILLAIAIATFQGPGLLSTLIAVGVVNIPIFIRLTRATVLGLREQEFVLAATALGGSPFQVVWRHILPASLAPVLVQATLSIGTATLEAAGLGFLGLGAQPPTPELGALLADAFKGGYSLSAPWTMICPGVVITLLVLGFNLLGDALRDALDPQG